MESSAGIEEKAATWIARRDAGTLTAVDEAELTQWLQTTANRVAFVRLDTAWRQAGRLKALGAGVQPGVVPSPGEWRRSQFFAPSRSTSGTSGTEENATHDRGARRLRAFHAIVASFLVAAVVGTGWYLWPHGPAYSTEVGGLTAVPMADGSKVTLNTDSEIRVLVSDSERRVELRHGEAFFEVARDPTRPFVVLAGDKRVIAVGTKFSVRRESDEVRVIVTEGHVRVEKSEAGHSVPIAQLSPGSVATTAGGGALVREKPVAQVEEYLSWQQGFVSFHETPLEEAVAELNRYNVRKIAIADPAVAAVRIGGNFRSTNVDAFVRLIEDGFPIRAERRDDQIVLHTREQ